ncbi:hypothetical protein ONS96_002318 [Cadophora gregata f. sp. sojae]|nr:hypothetical protein ONS96_002318 [Cadophora gregata f. sp. sojae]
MRTKQATEEKYKELRSRKPRPEYLHILTKIYSPNPPRLPKQELLLRFCHNVLQDQHIYEIGGNKPHMGLLTPFIDKYPSFQSAIDIYLNALPQADRCRIKRLGRDYIHLNHTTLIRTRGSWRKIDEPPIVDHVFKNFLSWRSIHWKDVKWSLDQIDDSLVDEDVKPLSPDQTDDSLTAEEDSPRLPGQPTSEEKMSSELEDESGTNTDTFNAVQTDTPRESSYSASNSQAADTPIQSCHKEDSNTPHVGDSSMQIRKTSNKPGIDDQNQKVSKSQNQNNDKSDIQDKTAAGDNELSLAKRKRSETNEGMGPDSKVPRPASILNLQHSQRLLSTQSRTQEISGIRSDVWDHQPLSVQKGVRDQIEAKGYSTSFLDRSLGPTSTQGQLKEASMGEIMSVVYGIREVVADLPHRPIVRYRPAVVQVDGSVESGVQGQAGGQSSETSGLEISTQNSYSPQLESRLNDKRPLTPSDVQSAPSSSRELLNGELGSSGNPTLTSAPQDGSSLNNPLVIDDKEDTSSSRLYLPRPLRDPSAGERTRRRIGFHGKAKPDSTTMHQQIPLATGYQNTPVSNNIQTFGPVYSQQQQTMLNQHQYPFSPNYPLMQQQPQAHPYHTQPPSQHTAYPNPAFQSQNFQQQVINFQNHALQQFFHGMTQLQQPFQPHPYYQQLATAPGVQTVPQQMGDQYILPQQMNHQYMGPQQIGPQHMEHQEMALRRMAKIAQQQAAQQQMGQLHGLVQAPHPQMIRPPHQHFRQNPPGHHNVRMPRELWRSRRSPSKSPRKRKSSRLVLP